MKIVKMCKDIGMLLGDETVSLHTLKPNTVFRYGGHSCGPYLRVSGGMVDLSTGSYTPVATGSAYNLTFYKELPDATLVTNEK